MYTIDDPMLALILRFVGCNQEINFRNHDFIQEQRQAIQEHVDKFPPEERRSRAMEWIESYAREYRESRMKEILDEMFSGQRCPDCPLSGVSGVNAPRQCQIHEEWLGLLQQYATDEIDAKEYVENSLQLLAQHKESLRMNLGMRSLGGG